jgi:hypothetical protein
LTARLKNDFQDKTIDTSPLSRERMLLQRQNIKIDKHCAREYAHERCQANVKFVGTFKQDDKKLASGMLVEDELYEIFGDKLADY